MRGLWLHHQITSAVALALVAGGTAGAAPVVDTIPVSPTTAVTREQLENLPVGRRLEDLIRTCPPDTIPTISRQPDILIDGKPFTPTSIECVQPEDLDMIEVYKVHNAARAEYGAPPLIWDPALVRTSAGVAHERARTGTHEHSSREGRGTVRENLSQGLPWWSTRQLLSSWEKEKKNFVPGIFPNVSKTYNWYDVGHWAMMIWVQTVLMGCAKAIGASASWLICHYNPGGNKDGKPVGIPPVQVAQGDREQEYQGASITFNKRLARRGSTTGQAPSQTPYHPPPGAAGIFNAPLTLGLCLDPAPDGPPLDVRELVYGGCYYPLQLEGSDWGYRGVLDGLLQSTGGTTDETFGEIRIPLLPERPVYFSNVNATAPEQVPQFPSQPSGPGQTPGENLPLQPERPLYFGGSSTTTSADDSIGPVTLNPFYEVDEPAGRASLFDLGIYGGGAWAPSWFDVGRTDGLLGHDDGSILNELYPGIRSDVWGFDQGFPDWFLHDFSEPSTPLIRYNQLQTQSTIGDDYGDRLSLEDFEAMQRYSRNQVPEAGGEVDTKVEQPTLPKAEVHNQCQPKSPSTSEELARKHLELAMKMAEGTPYERQLSNLTAGWSLYSQGIREGDPAKKLAGEGQVRAALGALKEIQNQLAEVGEFAGIDREEIATTIADHESLLDHYNKPSGSNAPAVTETDTKVEQPALPGSEGFNPADAPQCAADVM